MNRLAADGAEGVRRESARQWDLDPSGGEGPSVGLSLFSPRPHMDNVSLPSPPAGFHFSTSKISPGLISKTIWKNNNGGG